jgi:NADPH:quinone reductase
MKAAFFTETGPPDVIQYGELPKPKPGPDQCLIKVSAVDVNPIDTYVRGGLIKVPLSFPAVPGRDLAGTVVECGSNVKQFKPGTRVWATNQNAGGRPGTFSEFAVVDECWLYNTPDRVEDEDMAALSLVACTAHLGLARHAKVQPGEVLFVNGGSGGVGSSVVQMAKALGARVITTAGSPEKVERCRKLGADLAINYRSEDVASAVRKFAANGVDVWWETLREPDFEKTIPLLAMRGRMIVMAGRDARPQFPVGPFYVKDCSLFGFAMFNATADQLRTAAEDINQWAAEGKLKAQIDRVMPLSQTAEAHRLQEESTVHKKSLLQGKIVLKP